MARCPRNSPIVLSLLALLAGLTVYLIAAHYVKAYSDPVGFLFGAEALKDGRLLASRAPVFPVVLAFFLNLLGPAYIFLINLPLVVGLVALLYAVSVQIVNENAAGAEDRKTGHLIGFLAVSIFTIANRKFFPEIVNPFREPLAFSLVLGAAILLLEYRRRRSLFYPAVSALLMGIAIGTRETCVLFLPPIGLWLIIQWIREKRASWFYAGLVFGIGLAIGLAPFFFQNYVYSGNALIPSYSAGKWQDVAHHGLRDIPVAGMSFRYFSNTAPDSFVHFLHKYGPAGYPLFLTGLAMCIKRRMGSALLLLLPAALIHFFFYCFYWYVKGRYLFIVELFAVPFIAVGCMALLRFAAARLGTLTPLRIKRAELFLPVSIVGFALITLAFSASTGDGRLKVWHIKPFREYALSRLNSPATFLGNRHICHMLSWHLGGTPCELSLNFEESAGRKARLEDDFSEFGPSIIRSVSEGNYYVYGDRRPPLLKHWFDCEKVFSFSDVPVPVDHYGKPLTEGLYHVTPWKSREVERSLEVPSESEAYLLVVDCFRLWDYAGRSFCRLNVADSPASHELSSSGPQFFTVSSSAVRNGCIDVRLASDAPLPAMPAFEIIPMNSEWTMPLGAGYETWYYPYLSPDLLRASPLKSDGCMLFGHGEIELPVFAGRDREVFAEFRFEYVQDGIERDDTSCIVADGGHGSRQQLLPPKRAQDTLAVSLGQGTGDLVFQTVKFHTSLMDFAEQTSLINCRRLSKPNFVKLYDARIFTIPSGLKPDLQIDMGSACDAPFVNAGFYWRERYDPATVVRWTTGEGIVRLPLSRTGRDVTFSARCVAVSPSGYMETARFQFNAWQVPPDSVELSQLPDNRVEYTFVVPAQYVAAEGDSLLRIESRPWQPAETGISADTRKLGLMVERIDISPVAP